MKIVIIYIIVNITVLLLAKFNLLVDSVNAFVNNMLKHPVYCLGKNKIFRTVITCGVEIATFFRFIIRHLELSYISTGIYLVLCYCIDYSCVQILSDKGL